MDIKKKRKIVGLLLTSLGTFILLSVLFFSAEDSYRAKSEIKNLMGVVGDEVSRLLIIKTIGIASIAFPLLIMLWGIHLLTEKKIKPIKKITLYTLLFSLYTSMTLAFYGMIKSNLMVDETMIYAFRTEHQHWWGQIGEILSERFHGLFGTIGSIILFPTIVAITVLYVFDIKLEKIKSRLLPRLTIYVAKLTGRYDPRKFKPKKPVPDIRDILDLKRKPKEPEAFETEVAEPGVEVVPAAKPSAAPIPISDEELPGAPASPEKGMAEPRPRPQPARKYYFPSAQILDEPVTADDEVTWDELMTSAKTLEEKLADFGIQGKVVEINPGPVITRFELEPGLGVKINRFTSLADDLALVMRAKRIRVVAPIPGKAAIGVEIPNRKPSTVYIKSIIDSPQFRSAESPLTMALGKTIAGDIYVDDLARMPHLLIAGATGSGKSVCLNTIIAGILFKAHPSQVQLVLIDPKRLELSVYAALKNHHLAYRPDLEEEVVTNPNNAVAVLRSLEMEMERRYELLAKAGVRNIEDYNNWIKTLTPEQRAESIHQQPLEYVVLIIDELADLMLVAAKDVEEPIARLTQMSRAVGIHLIVATQRPSVDVITGVIKANFPARIAFQVASKTDSRTILDMNGAEKLLGRGDMLFLPPGSPEPIRIHGAYISHEEVKRIVEHIHQQPPQEPKFLLPTGEDEAAASYSKRFRDERDELFNEALKLVVRHQQGSVSLLQRRLKIGYARAARLIDQLEEAGFVGPFDGSKAREVLADEEQLKEMGIY